ncbi:MAG: serine hydrolase [Alphaproteobacteria bacterium]|nr:serine hydrolase [Alphaproteobacteria bacterium]
MLLALLLLLPALACPDDRSPDGPWPDDHAAVARDHADRVAALDAVFFPDVDWDDPDRAGVRTDGAVVIHRGRVVYERYRDPWGPGDRHLTWSVSKTVANTLTGIAVHEGRLSIDDSVCAHVQAPDAACAIRVVDLLEMSSGLDWKETYEHDPPTTSSVLAMLYGQGRDDMAAFVLGHPLRDAPGSTWMYSSGDTNALSAVVGAVMVPAHGERFPWAVLFDRLGMTTSTFERDGVGTYVGSSYWYASARDMGRLGQLWLQDGCWAGQRLLPEGWVHDSTRVTRGARERPLGSAPGDPVQGRLVWLNQPVPEQGHMHPAWPAAPPDTFAALGHWGQSIIVVPEHDLVVVRIADQRDDSFDRDGSLAAAIALAESL